MSSPTKDSISELNYSWLGKPFARYVAKSSIDTSQLDYSWLGQPFVSVSPPSELITELITAQERETIFSIYADWKNVFSKYK
jgi:hypothetical protein